MERLVRLMRRLIQTCLPALLFCAAGRADNIDLPLQIDIFLGSASLFASGGALLPMTNAVTVDMFLGPNLAAQIANDPSEPTYVRSHIGDFIGNTDLGAVFTPQVIPFDDAEQNLLNLLETQPQPFAITGDTGLFAVSAPFTLQYITGPFPDGLGNSVEGILNVSIYERDLQETVAAVPEPALCRLCARGLARDAVVRRRDRG
jgi:hypothetical protein